MAESLARRHFRRLMTVTVDSFRAAIRAGGTLVHRLADDMAQTMEHPRAEADHARVFPAGGEVDAAELPGMAPVEARALIDFILSKLPPKGDPALPDNVGVLGVLLSNQTPTRDFLAVDMLHACFPRGTRNSDSRLLMAVARNITRNFGRQGRLPIASGKAWSMLDPDLFNDELAAQMAAICAFISDWQATKQSFLILEFPEIELIEYLFENLHPRRHATLLTKVMDFKVLSTRRVGLLRRIPSRVRRFVANPEGRSPAQVQAYVDDTIAFLTALSRPENFAAVVAAAQLALAEMEKIAAQLVAATTTQLPPPDAAMASPPPVDAPPDLHPLMRGLSAPLPSALPASPTSSLPVTALVPPRKRFTRQQKTEAVLRVIQGEDRGWVALSLGIRPDLLDRWQTAFLNGGGVALAGGGKEETGAGDGDGSIEDLKGRLHDLIRTVEHLSAQISKASGDAPGDGPAAEPVYPHPDLAAKPKPPETKPAAPKRRRKKSTE